MKIYIASSLNNLDRVKGIATALRAVGHTVTSCVESTCAELDNHVIKGMDYNEWLSCDASKEAFKDTVRDACSSDLVLYCGDGDKDAVAEMAIAWTVGIPIYGLRVDGEDLRLMRKMVTLWFGTVERLLEAALTYDYETVSSSM